MNYGVVAVFGCFLAGGLLSMILLRARISLAVLWVIGAAGLIVFGGLLLFMPCLGLWSEVLLCAAAVVSLVGPASLIMRPESKRESDGIERIPIPLIGVIFLVVLFPLTLRLSLATRLAWTCDGEIVKQYRSSNHQAFSVQVKTGGRIESFEAVDEGFWRQATAGRHLKKRPGTAFATLDGTRVRMVPQSHWEPPSPMD